MPWLKQNLSLVIGGVIALVALSFAGLWTKQQYDANLKALMRNWPAKALRSKVCLSAKPPH